MYPDIHPSDYHVWNELQQFVYNNQSYQFLSYFNIELIIFCRLFKDALNIETTRRRVIWGLMNDKLGRMWKEAAVDISRYYPRNLLEGPKKTTKILSVLVEIEPSIC